MRRLLERRDAWGNPMAVWVIAAAAFAVPLIGYAMSFVRLENDVAHWLPDHDPLSRTFAWFRGHFPADEKVMISWRGTRLDDPRLERLAAALRGTVDEFGVRRDGSRHVAEVLTPEEAVEQIARRGVDREEALRRLTGLLVGKPNGGGAATRPAALIVTLSDAGQADHAAAVADLTAAAITAGVAEDELALGGASVAGTALNASLKRAGWNRDVPGWMAHRRSPLLLSLAVSVGLAFALLRRVRLTALVLAATLLATFGTIALVPATGGGMNMVLVVMPTLMMVLTLSAAIHVVNYYGRAARAGEPDPATAAVRAAVRPCVLAALTTAIGLISLAGSPLAPVRDFGIYSAVGCLILLPVVLWLLPAALQLWPITVSAEGAARSRAWRRLGGMLVRWRRLVTMIGLACFVTGIGGLYWFRTETKAIRYFPGGARVVRDYEFLERELTGILPVEAVVVFDADAQKRLKFSERLERVRAVTEAVRRHPEVSGAMSLADLLPVAAPPQPGASFTEKAKYHRRSSLIEERVKREGAEAAAFLSACRTPSSAVGKDGRPLAEAGDELWRVTAHAAVLSDYDLSRLLADLDAAVVGGLKGEAGACHVVTGAVPLFLRTQQAVLDSLIWSFATAFVLIAGVMVWMLGGVRAGLIAMLPNLLPVAVVFGGISLAGIAVDVGTMITASIALGVAVDGTLHLCEVFREEIARGGSRRRAVADSLAACGPALCQTTLVVSGGLVMLAGADLLLVARFGWLMAALVATALLGDVLLLPALLAGPLGRLLTPVRKEAVASETGRRWSIPLAFGRRLGRPQEAVARSRSAA